MRAHLYILCLLFAAGISAQDTLFRIDHLVFFQLDPLGQLIYQDEAGRLFRRDLAADTLYVFDDNLLGDISYVDASNPFGPLVYFEDFDLLLLLDRTLNEVGRLDYRSSKVISSSKAVARNFDNRVWLFDRGDFRLKLLDNEGEIVQQSDDLRRLLNVYDPPSQLFINASMLYAYYPGHGIAVFSNFGRFLRWEAQELDVPQLVFDTRRGLGWRIHDTYHLLSNTGNIKKFKLPDWATTLQEQDIVLPVSGGYWVQQGKSLFYLK